MTVDRIGILLFLHWGLILLRLSNIVCPWYTLIFIYHIFGNKMQFWSNLVIDQKKIILSFPVHIIFSFVHHIIWGKAVIFCILKKMEVHRGNNQAQQRKKKAAETECRQVTQTCSAQWHIKKYGKHDSSWGEERDPSSNPLVLDDVCFPAWGWIIFLLMCSVKKDNNHPFRTLSLTKHNVCFSSCFLSKLLRYEKCVPEPFFSFKH